MISPSDPRNPERIAENIRRCEGILRDHRPDSSMQLRDFAETTHTSTPGPFYHKSIRLKIDDNLIIEFHGPNVRGNKGSK